MTYHSSSPTPNAQQMYPLNYLSLIRFSGQDCRQFLQGQLSNDLTALTGSRSLLASCNSAQGRVQAILHLFELDGAILGLLPRSMASVLATRLRKYVLRAKVTIEDASDLMRIDWVSRDELKGLTMPIPESLGEYAQYQGHTIVRWPDPMSERFLLIQSGTAPTSDADIERRWQLAEIKAGLPQVAPETHEEFVAQMLNLDILGGISFNKGCYTGQEIIARAHFRGAVKRRMFRYRAQCEAPTPGSKILAHGETAGEVVIAAQDGKDCEILAVISLPHAQHLLTLAHTGTTLHAMPLPYTVPTEI